MKCLLLLLCLLSGLAKAQDCSLYIRTIEDKIEGKSITSMAKTIVGIDGDYSVKINLIKGPQKSVLLNLSASPSICFEKYTRVIFLFTDSSRLEMKVGEKFSCSGRLLIAFSDMMANMDDANILSTKTIDAFRIWHTSGSIDLQLNKEDAVQIRNSFNCLLKD